MGSTFRFHHNYRNTRTIRPFFSSVKNFGRLRYWLICRGVLGPVSTTKSNFLNHGSNSPKKPLYRVCWDTTCSLKAKLLIQVREILIMYGVAQGRTSRCHLVQRMDACYGISGEVWMTVVLKKIPGKRGVPSLRSQLMYAGHLVTS